MTEKLILPPGYVNVGYLAEGGQAMIYKVIPPTGATAQDSGFFSLKDGAASMPQTLVIRQVLNFDPQPQANETEEERNERVRNLRALAREVNVSIHFAAGHPFVDVIGIYTGQHINRGAKQLNFIMPHYDTSLWHYVSSTKLFEDRYGRSTKGYLNEDVLRVIMVQLLAALKKMHSKGFAHRDATAANILLQNSTAGPLIHLADFGFSQLSGCLTGVYETYEEVTKIGQSETLKEFAEATKHGDDNDDEDDGGFDLGSDDEDEEKKDLPPLSAYHLTNSKQGPYTGAGTIPFRAPESLFHCSNLDTTKLDIWAAGVDLLFCIFRGIDFIPETRNERLFSRNSELEQLIQIFSLIAPYDAACWERIATNRHVNLHANIMHAPKKFILDGHRLLSDKELSPACLEVLKAMLQPDPSKRPTASSLLEYAWFSNSETAMLIINDIERMLPPVNIEPRIDFTNKSEEEIRQYLTDKAPIIVDRV